MKRPQQNHTPNIPKHRMSVAIWMSRGEYSLIYIYIFCFLIQDHLSACHLQAMLHSFSLRFSTSFEHCLAFARTRAVLTMFGCFGKNVACKDNPQNSKSDWVELRVSFPSGSSRSRKSVFETWRVEKGIDEWIHIGKLWQHPQILQMAGLVEDTHTKSLGKTSGQNCDFW